MKEGEDYLVNRSLKCARSQLYNYVCNISQAPWDVNPLNPMSDQERISPHYIHTVSCRQVMRIKKNNNYGITN